MPNDCHLRNPTKCTPRKLARKIESYIIRNALEEEQRAQKALHLLQARDRQIAILEKRVVELESTAENLHEFTLRKCSKTTLSGKEDKKVGYEIPRSEKSLQTEDDIDVNDKSEYEYYSTSSRDEDVETFRENRDTLQETPVPPLELSKSSTSNSEKEICSSVIDFVLEKSNCFPSSTTIWNWEETSEKVSARDEKSNKDTVNCACETGTETVNNREMVDSDDDTVKETSEENVSTSRTLCENTIGKRNRSTMSAGFSKEKPRVPPGKQQRSNYPRVSLSVPWIRAKHGYRNKRRARRRMERLLTGDGYQLESGTVRKNSLNRRQEGEGEMIYRTKRTKRKGSQEGRRVSSVDKQETRLIVDNIETKAVCTQTLVQAIELNEKDVQTDELAAEVNQLPPSCKHMERKKSSTFCSSNEDLVPQWLIEEALNRGNELCKEYEIIISDLEAKLAHTRENLEKALKAKSAVKEKYKKFLEETKAEAHRENEALQERIVRICTSVLENFGPRSMNRSCTYQIKAHKKLKCREKILKRLYKKLRMAVAKSNKLERELASTRKRLESKSEDHESISKCFEELKQEMDATETNLNNLISENLALRKKMEETRNWLQSTAGKEQQANRSQDVYKNRELNNLKKKNEENATTIAQLKNKLARAESANANKGFLLNSYKSQLSELNKEKNQLLANISKLENEVINTRSNNSHLKTKITILSTEKDKLLSENEKSMSEAKEKMESQLSKKYKELAYHETEAIKAKYDETIKSMRATLQQEIETIKTKHDETIKSMKAKLLVMRNENAEYSNAIKEFLKKLYEQQRDQELQKSLNESEPSEKEAQETACTILNMTPDELSGFINGKTKNSINPWITELNGITATNHFAQGLSKFLLKKVTKTTKK